MIFLQTQLAYFNNIFAYIACFLRYSMTLSIISGLYFYISIIDYYRSFIKVLDATGYFTNSKRLRALKMARMEALVILELTPTPKVALPLVKSTI